MPEISHVTGPISVHVMNVGKLLRDIFRQRPEVALVSRKVLAQNGYLVAKNGGGAGALDMLLMMVMQQVEKVLRAYRGR